MSQLYFGDKASTLKLLSEKISHLNILPQFVILGSSWIRTPEEELQKVCDFFSSVELFCVRSNSTWEDSYTESRAGQYLSLLNVSHGDLKQAIDQVFSSYQQKSIADQSVLIQPQLVGIDYTGVVFSHCLNTCSPYVVVEMVKTCDSSLVTAGGRRRPEDEEIWRVIPGETDNVPKNIAKLVSLVTELQLAFRHPVEIEFAFKKGVLWLFQARPLVLARPPLPLGDLQSKTALIGDYVETRARRSSLVVGEKAIFGTMPDWNPAEIIGVRPKPLSLSLYKTLVTDAIWAYQRSNYGYRNLRGHPLLVSLGGLPYIDLRLSFNSFVPATIEDPLAEKLVNFYLRKVESSPHLHDKIEFEVIFSCFTFDIDERLIELEENGVSKAEVKELKENLLSLTKRIINPNHSVFLTDIERLKVLQTKRDNLNSAEVSKIEKIFWLLEDGRRYGSLPFAGMARAGFVAIQILESLKKVGILSSEEAYQFRKSISTVSGQLNRDLSVLNKSEFLRKYGHLRPGTYEITSLRYDEAAEVYFDWNCEQAKKYGSENRFQLSDGSKRKLNLLLQKNGFEVDADGLLDFIAKGIVYRELAKFEFSKNLSAALVLIADLGEEYGFSRNEMAFIDIVDVLSLYSKAENIATNINGSIERGKKSYDTCERLFLPHLISESRQIFAFKESPFVPNYITNKVAFGSVVDDLTMPDELAGSIVFLESADPGFDWIFTKEVCGFVTCWGGANSHMAIRAAELGLPAVIGAGPTQFKYWLSFRKLELDCLNRTVRCIS